MPLVTGWYDSMKLEVELGASVQDLKPRIASAVALALHTKENEDGHLRPEDVEVRLFPYGHQIPAYMFLNSKDFTLVVEANDVPERKANLDARRWQIGRSIRKRLPKGVSVSIWVRLTTGSFGEFTT